MSNMKALAERLATATEEDGIIFFPISGVEVYTLAEAIAMSDQADSITWVDTGRAADDDDEFAQEEISYKEAQEIQNMWAAIGSPPPNERAESLRKVADWCDANPDEDISVIVQLYGTGSFIIEHITAITGIAPHYNIDEVGNLHLTVKGPVQVVGVARDWKRPTPLPDWAQSLEIK